MVNGSGMSTLLPVSGEFHEDWTIKISYWENISCKNYLSPNIPDYYKILLITKGAGVFTLGAKIYNINEPTILFIHPGEIISWRKLGDELAGYSCLFKKRFIENRPALKMEMDKYNLFTDNSNSVIRLSEPAVSSINRLFLHMQEEDMTWLALAEDALQAYIQLIMIESTKVATYLKPDPFTDESKHVYAFFQLLEKETSGINYTRPIRIKTAKEFADNLAMHPNHLNLLLKKHTGQNVSSHIKGRLLEESKILLRQTDWTLQCIGYAIGFAEQPNFSEFFKKNLGITPAEFRRVHDV
jgi:AraC family transcriptional activator of pobA